MEEERTIQSLRGDNLWKGGFPLRVVRYDHRRNRRMHQHDFFELVLVTSGHSRHVTPNGSCEISAGDIFLIRPGTAHAYEAVSDFSLVNLIYAPNLLPLCDLAKSPGYQALFVLEPEQWRPEVNSVISGSTGKRCTAPKSKSNGSTARWRKTSRDTSFGLWPSSWESSECSRTTSQNLPCRQSVRSSSGSAWCSVIWKKITVCH